jgi:lipopolysaccharide biosynthesis glycosyltransferase
LHGLITNRLGVLWGKPEDERLRRLNSNGIALWHLLTGRCDRRPQACSPPLSSQGNEDERSCILTTLPIPVLFCTDSNYWQHMGAALASLLVSNTRHQFRIMVCSIQPDPESESKTRQIAVEYGNATVEFIRFTPDIESFPISGHITPGAYLRLFMTEYVDPTLEKLLYLDCDLIVRKDIEALWAVDIDNYLAAAALEPYLEEHQALGFAPGDAYFNSGVMLINLTQWRSQDLPAKFIACANQRYSALTYWDQDILNIALRGQVAFFSPRWNFLAIYAEMLPEQLRLTRDQFLSIRRDPGIIHFTTAFKPWQYIPEPQYKRCYWEALSLTPWRGVAPQGYTPANVLRKALKMKRLKQQVRLHGALSIYVLSKLVKRPMLWSDVSPPPSHLTLA